MGKIKNPVVLIHKRENSDTYAVAITNGSQDYHDAVLMATMEPDMIGDDVDTWSKTGYYMAAEIERLKQALSAAENNLIDSECRVAELEIARDKCFLSGLKTGWEYGIADETEGYNREIADARAVIERAATLERQSVGHVDGHSPTATLFHGKAKAVYPDTLPCAVELKPGFILGKGCKTGVLLTALQRRADYCAEIDPMTPKERAEHDANIEAFKAMLPMPASERTTIRRSAEHKARLSEASSLLSEMNPGICNVGKPLTITLPDISSKAFWSGTGKSETFHPETYKSWVKEAIERAGFIAGIGVEVK